jgi:hypothetical protein
MKVFGYDVYVLYVTYIIKGQRCNQFTLVIFYQYLVPYVNGTGRPTSYNMIYNLQACASTPAKFAEASNPAALDAAMAAIIGAAINAAPLKD